MVNLLDSCDATELEPRCAPVTQGRRFGIQEKTEVLVLLDFVSLSPLDQVLNWNGTVMFQVNLKDRFRDQTDDDIYFLFL